MIKSSLEQLAFNCHPNELLNVKLTAIPLISKSGSHRVHFELKNVRWASISVTNNGVLIAGTNEPPYLVAYNSLRIEHDGMDTNKKIGLYCRLTENNVVDTQPKIKTTPRATLFLSASLINPIWEIALIRLIKLLKEDRLKEKSDRTQFNYMPIRSDYQPNQPHQARITHQLIKNTLTIEVTEGGCIHIPDHNTLIKQYNAGLIKLSVGDSIDVTHFINCIGANKDSSVTFKGALPHLDFMNEYE